MKLFCHLLLLEVVSVFQVVDRLGEPLVPDGPLESLSKVHPWRVEAQSVILFLVHWLLQLSVERRLGLLQDLQLRR